jgi:hypothetical protein
VSCRAKAQPAAKRGEPDWLPQGLHTTSAAGQRPPVHRTNHGHAGSESRGQLRRGQLHGGCVGGKRISGLAADLYGGLGAAELDVAVFGGCPPSALMRQIGWVEEGRISGSS